MKKYIFLIFVMITCSASVVFPQKKERNNDSKSSLDANFSASATNIIAGDCINFFDFTTGTPGPSYWRWTFEGAEPEISYAQHPQNICYYVPGTYFVSLEVQNATGIDTEMRYGFITVTDNTTTPIAYFQATTPTTIPVGSTVMFENLSQNGPFDEVTWWFQGGAPSYFYQDNLQTPVRYDALGTFDVQLTVKNAQGEHSIKKVNYVHVVPQATNPPIAEFEVDKLYIAPGDVVNFIDLSKNNPFEWEWVFEGATLPVPSVVKQQNPSGIMYPSAGTYCVKLICKNNVGTDTIEKCSYIRVSTADPCTQGVPAPIADFEGSPRMIAVGEKVYFKDRSENYPTIWNWQFPGGVPGFSVSSNVIRGVTYNTSNNFYDVTLAVTDACGRIDYMVKENYVMVFSGPVALYCDTISNINRKTEYPSCPVAPNGATWGYLSGLNSNKTFCYAEKFHQYQFDYVHEIVMSVVHSKAIDNTKSVTFYVWDGSTTYPDSILGEKTVLLKNLPSNFWNSVVFDEPIKVKGPFFLGYKVNYAKGANTEENNVQFAISLVERGNHQGLNTFYIQGQDSLWLSAYQRYGKAYSSSLSPKMCSVDAEDFDLKANIEIYPNPAIDKFSISTGELSIGKEIFINIYDLTGRSVYERSTKISGENIEINTSSFQSGLYLVSINIDGKLASRKVLIHK